VKQIDALFDAPSKTSHEVLGVSVLVEKRTLDHSAPLVSRCARGKIPRTVDGHGYRL